MRAAALIAGALALGGTGGVLLGGCGGATKTVTISAAPTTDGESGGTGHGGESGGTAHSTSTTGARTTNSTPETSTGTAGNGQSTSSGASRESPSATRTAPGPAFTHTGTQPEEAAGAQATAAAAVVRTQGYTPNDTSEYHPNQTLTVLLGTRTGSADGYNQRAFFFLDGHYIGTDSSQPSAALRVLSQSDTEVTLAYALYRAHDALCCPSGGQATVHFQLNNGKLVPLDPIPPVASATGLARQ
jgi:LppP/LprE lipoprotein